MPTLFVELQKSHTHAGTLLEPGDVIELPADLAQWLCEIGSAQPVAKASSVTQASKQPITTQE